jgi:hypothetical protein
MIIIIIRKQINHFSFDSYNLIQQNNPFATMLKNQHRLIAKHYKKSS